MKRWQLGKVYGLGKALKSAIRMDVSEKLRCKCKSIRKVIIIIIAGVEFCTNLLANECTYAFVSETNK